MAAVAWVCAAQGVRRPMALDDLHRIAAVSDARLSPDGEKVAWVVTTVDRKANRRVPAIWVADSDGRDAPRVWAGAGASNPRWNSDGTRLGFVALREGAPKAQVYALNADGGEAQRISDLPDAVSAFEWSPDGSRVVCVSRVAAPPAVSDVRRYLNANYKQNGAGFDDGRRAHLFVVDVKSGRHRQLTSDDSRDDTEPQWSPDGRAIAFIGQRTDQDMLRNSDVWVVAAEGGVARVVSSHRSQTTHPRWSPDGTHLAYTAAEGDDDPARLWVAPQAGGPSVPAWRDVDMTLPEFAWNGAAFDVLLPLRGTQHVYRTADGQLRALTTGDRVVQSFDVAPGRVAFVASDFTHPGEVYVADRDFRNERRMSHVGDSVVAAVQPVERFTFAGADGWEVEAFLVKPYAWRAGAKYPMVLSIHGGPSAMYGVGWNEEFQVFAAQGWAFLYVNPRGSYGYGEKFRRGVDGEWGGKAYEDVMKCVDAALVHYPWIDAQRLGVRGQSFGGFMTNWIVSHTARFRAAVTMSSIANFLSLEGTRDAAYGHARDFGGDLFANFDLFWKYSPVRYAASVKTPVLVLHGEADHRVPLEQGEQWFRALQHFKVPSELVIFPREDHSLHREPAHAVELMERQVAWFARYFNALQAH